GWGWDRPYPDLAKLLYTFSGIHVNYFESTPADHAIPHNTPWHEPQGPMVVPGQYEIRLTVDGKSFRQPIAVNLDPRLHYSTRELQRQLDLSQRIAVAMEATYESYKQLAQFQKELADRTASLQEPKVLGATKALETSAQRLNDDSEPRKGFGPLNRDLTRLMIAVNQSDSPPASELITAFSGMCLDV